MMQRISTTDPVTLHDIPDPEGMPDVVESNTVEDITIYFESKASRQMYLEVPVENPAKDLKTNLNSPEVGGIDND